MISLKRGLKLSNIDNLSVLFMHVLICLIRLDFLLLRGDQFEDLLVVLWPCRAKGHVLLDHPFLCAFVCFWIIFSC